MTHYRINDAQAEQHSHHKGQQALDMKTTILFDHDGTLIDSETTHYALWKQVLKDYGVDLGFAFYQENMAGVPTTQNAIDVVKAFSLSVEASVLEGKKHQSLTAYLAKQAFPAMADTVDVVRRAYAAGYVLGIVTGGSRESVNTTLSTYGIGECFSTIVAVEDVIHSKPAPDCYLLAMQQLGVNASQCVAVEDTEHGMRAALGAGISCAVIPTVLTESLAFEGACGRFNSLSDWYDSMARENR